jgi:transcriptional regulator with XRE-family HTH domain
MSQGYPNVPDHQSTPPRSRLFTADPIDHRVAERIAARRRALGIDPQLLDAILDFRDGTIERLEAGESRIGATHLFRLAEIFDVDIDWFFADAPDPLPSEPDRSPSSGHGQDGAQTRRFVTLYRRLRDPKVRLEVREMVRALAAHLPSDHASDLAGNRRAEAMDNTPLAARSRTR